LTISLCPVTEYAFFLGAHGMLNKIEHIK
jgi:hypothetical protein